MNSNRICNVSLLRSEMRSIRADGNLAQKWATQRRITMRTLAPFLAALIGVVGTSALGGYMVTVTYIGGTGDAVIAACRAGRPLVTNIGGACFNVPSTSTTAAVTIHDNSGREAAGILEFLDSGGNVLGPALIVCGGNPSVAVPSGSTGADLTVDEALAPLDCPGASPGTTGTITAAFN